MLPEGILNTYSQKRIDPKHPVLTQSSLGMLEACAFAFNLRYLKGKPEAPSGAITRGRAFDEAVTFGANHVIVNGEDAKLSDKKEVAAAKFDKEAPETNFQGDDPSQLKDSTVALVELHHNQIAPTLSPVATQEIIRVSGAEYDLAGTLDLIEKKGEAVNVTDHKTCKRKGKYSPRGHVQAALYAYLYEKKYQVRPQFRFDVAIATKSPSIERVEHAIDDAEYSLLHYRIRSALNEIKQGLETGHWRLAEQGHWRCDATGKWCAYISECPKGKR